jgi:hypothetical protein
MATVGSVDPPAGPRTFAIQILEDGFFCGVLGAGVVALWYLVLDTLAGRPLFTPSLLGSLLFQKGAALSNVTIQPQVVFWYTAVHAFAFLIVGMIAAWLAAQFEKFPSVGIAMLFLFVFFETAFFAFALAVGKTVLGTLGLWTIGVANLLAAAAMAGYLWWKHPSAVRNMKAIWTAQE